MTDPNIKKALISVYDKAGLKDLCTALHKAKVEIYSTGGTAKAISEMGIPVEAVDKLTQFPEMMDGRVKTLHPVIFGGVLARRYEPKDLEEAKRFNVPLFDLVVVNLYPFWEHIGKPHNEQASFIDIGGPSLLRAAAKNCHSVSVLSSAEDYNEFLEEFEKSKGTTTFEMRKRWAAKTFGRTSAYDAMVSGEWSAAELPTQLTLSPQSFLRYGENPHQKAAYVKSEHSWRVLQGKELSYNNLLDADAALRLVSEFQTPSCVIVKHNNPCGVATGAQPLAKIFSSALAADPKSAFGGIVAFNREVDLETATEATKIFLEVVIAPKFHPEAINLFATKKNLRLIEWENPKLSPVEVRASLGGWLIQESDLPEGTVAMNSVTQKKANDTRDLEFAWKVCKHVRSNAIVIAKNGVTLGIGAGQMSRVDAVQIALEKARASGQMDGAVLASDAFFPFRDNIDLLKETGVSAIIQPGGSMRDEEVVNACDELGIAMVFTRRRHFRH